MNKSFSEDIVGIDIFLERRETRAYVGNLIRENSDGKAWFHLKYNYQYMNSKFAVSLGPELPLTHQDYRSQILFTAFKDRIPSKDGRWCQVWTLDILCHHDPTGICRRI